MSANCEMAPSARRAAPVLLPTRRGQRTRWLGTFAVAQALMRVASVFASQRAVDRLIHIFITGSRLLRLRDSVPINFFQNLGASSSQQGLTCLFTETHRIVALA